MKKAIVLILFFHFADPLGLCSQNKLVKQLQQGSAFKSKAIENNLQAASSSTNSLPGRSVNYYWDGVTSQWQYVDSSLYTYNQTGELVSETKRDGSPFFRFTTTYDAQGRITQYVYQNWDSFLDAWKNNSRTTFLFNSHGYLIQNLTENYNYSSNQWEIQFGTKNVLTYDASNRIVDNIYQNWDLPNYTWKNYYRETAFTFDGNNNVLSLEFQIPNGTTWDKNYKYNLVYALNNQPVQLTMQNWNGTSFVNDSRWINLTFENWCGWYCDGISIQTGTLQSWGSPQNNQWNTAQRVSNVYDAFGGSVETWQAYNGSTWINASRNSESYDNKFMYTGSHGESWSTVNNSWQTFYQNKLIHAYDFNANVVQTISQYWNNTDSTLVNQHKKVYSGFSFVGLGENLNDPRSITIYPNPCSEACTLEISEAMTGADAGKTFVIYDAHGKQVYSEMITSSKLRFNTTGFQQGIYFYQVNANGQTLASGKLLIN